LKVKDIADAAMFLIDVSTVTGQILYVDGGDDFGRWRTNANEITGI